MSDEIDELVQKLRDTTEKIGLYMHGATVQSSAEPEVLQSELAQGKTIRDLIEGESVDFLIRATFNVGEVAWSDRVLDPERAVADFDFRVAAPTENEIALEVIRREIREQKKRDADNAGGAEELG